MLPSAELRGVTLDCADPQTLAGFYGALTGMRELFSRHALIRRYVAIVRLTAGAPRGSDHGVIDLPVHTEYIAGRRRIARAGEPSLPAATRYRIRERFGDAAVGRVLRRDGEH